MIEVEKKFSLQPGDEAKLIAGATFVKEIVMRDDYYDLPDKSWTLKDTWLRCRNGAWELKVPLNTAGSDSRVADQYRELTTEAEIAAHLKLTRSGTLTDALKEAGYILLAPIMTTRRKYQHGEFIIDIDHMDFGYDIAEIELLVERENEMPAAITKILELAGSIGLSTAPVRGKVVEYIRRNDPAHLEALQKALVV